MNGNHGNQRPETFSSVPRCMVVSGVIEGLTLCGFLKLQNRFAWINKCQ